MKQVPLNDETNFHLVSGLWKGARAPLKHAKVLRAKNFAGDGLLDFDDVVEMDVEERYFPERQLARGDIVVERSGGGPKQPVGRVALFVPPDKFPYFSSNFTTALRIRDHATFDPDYVALYLHALYLDGGTATLQRATTGIRNLDWHEYLRVEVPARPLDDQKRLVDLIGGVRKAYRIDDELIDVFAELKQTTMRELFSRGLRGEAQKETEIGPIPESWTLGPLGDLAQFQRGFDITKSTQAEGGTVPVVSSGGIKSFHDVAAVSGPGVVIGRKGSIGSVHYVDSDYWPHDTTLWCKDFLGNLPKFVFYRLQLVDMKRLDSGAANPALNRNFLHAEVIAWPDVEEQQQIVDVVELIDRKLDLHRRKRDTLHQLFNSLLHKLITGEISVGDLDLSASPASDGSAA